MIAVLISLWMILLFFSYLFRFGKEMFGSTQEDQPKTEEEILKELTVDEMIDNLGQSFEIWNAGGKKV